MYLHAATQGFQPVIRASLLISFTGLKSTLFDMARAAGTPRTPPRSHTRAGTRTCARYRAPERPAQTHAQMREAHRARARARPHPPPEILPPSLSASLPHPPPPHRPALWQIVALYRCRYRPLRAHRRGNLCRRRRPGRDPQRRRTRPGGARHDEYSRSTHGYSEYLKYPFTAGAALLGGNTGCSVI